MSGLDFFWISGSVEDTFVDFVFKCHDSAN